MATQGCLLCSLAHPLPVTVETKTGVTAKPGAEEKYKLPQGVTAVMQPELQVAADASTRAAACAAALPGHNLVLQSASLPIA